MRQNLPHDSTVARGDQTSNPPRGCLHHKPCQRGKPLISESNPAQQSESCQNLERSSQQPSSSQVQTETFLVLKGLFVAVLDGSVMCGWAGHRLLSRPFISWQRQFLDKQQLETEWGQMWLVSLWHGSVCLLWLVVLYIISAPSYYILLNNLNIFWEPHCLLEKRLFWFCLKP